MAAPCPPRLLRRRASALLAVGLALAAPVAGPVRAQTAPPAPVQVTALAAPDLFSAGSPYTGLGPDLWRGASAVTARDVIPALRPRGLSPAARTLARRLLATGGPAPDGAGADPALAAARLSALLDLGDAATVLSIIDRTPNVERSEPLSRAGAEAALALSQDARACALLQALQQGRDGPWWLRLRALCLTGAGRGEEAQIAVDLAGQSAPKGGRGGDPFIRLLGLRLAGGGAGAAPLAGDGLEYALSRSLGLDLAPAMASAAPAIQVAVAVDPKASPAARMIAAAYALRLNLITAEVARAAYLAGAATVGAGAPEPADATPALRARGRGRTGRRATAPLEVRRGLDLAGEARRFAALEGAPTPAAKADALADLLGHAESGAGLTALAKLAQPEIDRLPPTPGARGVLFASGAAAAGDLAAARALRLPLAADGANAVSPGELALLDGLIAAASGQVPGPVLDRLAERGAAGDAATAARARGAAVLLLALSDPQGAPLGGEARGELARFDVGPAAAPAARALALDAAADAGLKGETGLLALSIAQTATSGAGALMLQIWAAGVGTAVGSVTQPVADRARIVRDLGRARLAADAQAFAVEGLLELQRR